MADDSQVMMEMGFNVIYLIYIICIVSIMAKKYGSLAEEKKKSAKFVLLAFASLLIGDIGHVGARLIAFFSGDIDSNYAILGLGSLFEMVGLIFLFMFWTVAWLVEYKHEKTILFYVLIAIGLIGLVIFALPQNDWMGETAPYTWLVIRNIPWLIQGLAVSILLMKGGKEHDDALIKRIGLCIFISFFFYMPVVFFGYLQPMLGMLMIPGTIIYMIWQYTSIKRFF
jgi:hypothetical protein